MESGMKSEMSIIMIAISVIAGLVITMNILVTNPKHIRIHINDFYMAFLMAGVMLLLGSIVFYNSIDNVNTLIIISILIIVFTFIAIRYQFLVDDDQYLSGMIPHHSMAVLMSEKIIDKTKNPRVKKLATNIIKNQNEEINEILDILNNS